MEINGNMQTGACEIDGNKEKLIETNGNLLKKIEICSLVLAKQIEIL